MGIDRRFFLKTGFVVGATGLAGMSPLTRALMAHSGKGKDEKDEEKAEEEMEISGDGDFIPSFTPFTVAMPKPPVLTQTLLDPVPGSPDALVGSAAVFHGITPEFFPDHPIHAAANSGDPGGAWDRFTDGGGPNGEELHHITMKEGTHEFIPGINTPIFGYADTDGVARFPGPTILARTGQAKVLRFFNDLPAETSVHLHGDHSPAHSDGYPDFYVLQGEARDYYYPNTSPRTGQTPDFPQTALVNNGPLEVPCQPTTMWYHDHGMDITGFTVSSGLAGFYLITNDREDELIAANVLPEFYGDFDIPIALQDQLFNEDGTLFYDFFDHNGRIGNVFTVNGVAQPFFNVERKKYRFRFLNASNARIYHLRLSTGEPFIQIGQDTWEFPEAISIESFDLWMAQRVDCIIDFRNAPEVVYLENIMEQTDGRKPDGVNPDNPTPLVEFRVSGTPMNNISVEPGTAIRGPFIPITEDEICATRTFEFVRRNGAWQINNMFFSPRRSDVVPLQNSAERWIFINKSGGWVHPIHIHLESHQIQKFNGKTPPPSLRFNVDLSPLEEGGTSEFFIKFRTFTGPFVFHCHNLEHEDMRMMHVFDPRPAGMESLNNGVRPHNSTDFVDEYGFTAEQITGMPIVPPDNTLLFDNEGDVDRLEGRGVGIPVDDFEPGGETMPPVK